MKKVKTLLLLVASAFALTGCFGGGDSSGGGSQSGGGSTPTKTTFGLGEKFTFDKLDLTFKSDIVYSVVDSMFSDNDGKTAFGIPVTMTNHKDEPHSLNMFYYDCYSPKGSKIDNASAYFDNSMDWGGNILPGATATRYLYFYYDGAGEYTVALDNFSQKIYVKFNLNYIVPDPIIEEDPELDKVFVFENMELTFSSDYSIIICENSFMTPPSKEVVKMPVTVKNIGKSSTSLSFLDVNVFGPSGTQISDMCSYYYDTDSVESGGSLQPGASYTKSFYFDYVGDGEYKIEFGAIKVEKILKFTIQKAQSN